MQCPLCLSINTSYYSEDRRRIYQKCHYCQLVFVPPESHPNAYQEKKRYDAHQNSIHDMNYRSHLGRIAYPMLERIPKGATGLDFGCGPEPVLKDIFSKQGVAVDVYDAFYYPDDDIFNNKYDFITATEVIEHFHNPNSEIQRLNEMLFPGGYLGIMTRLLPPSLEEFNQWFYKRDFTHVCFYSEKTLKWLSDHYNMTLEIIAPDLFFFRKMG